MKNNLLLIVLLLLVCPLFASEPLKEADSPTGSDVGRFQILRVEGEAEANLTASKQVVVFRLDTVTGRTWKLVMTLIDERYVEGWIEVPVLELKDLKR